MSYALSLDKFNFKFSRQKGYFFRNVSVQITQGGLHFVRGQNGAGKSTFFNVLRGAIDSQESVEGVLGFKGLVYDFATNRSAALLTLQESVKLVQQNFDLMLADQLTFDENLQVARMQKFPGLDFLPEKKMQPLFVERFGIPHNKPVYLLSGGQRQMLAILMALQKPTDVLLLDEPTAALDPFNAKMVMEFLKTLVAESGLTVLIISHDLELIENYSDGRYYQLVVDQESGERSVQFIDK